MAQTMIDRIDERLAALGLSQRAAGLEATGNGDLIRGLRRNPLRQMNVRSLSALAEVLKTSERWLLSGEGEPGPVPDDAPEGEAQTGGEAPANHRPIPRTQGFNLLAAVPLEELRGIMPKDIPVLGTGAASAISKRGGFEIEPHVIDVVRRPPALMEVPDAYAIIITGASMIPEHKPGEVRLVNPRLRPLIGDTVILSSKHSEADPVEGYVGHLQRRTALSTTLGKLNPVERIEFDNRYVLSIHKIMTMNDLLEF